MATVMEEKLKEAQEKKAAQDPFGLNGFNIEDLMENEQSPEEIAKAEAEAKAKAEAEAKTKAEKRAEAEELSRAKDEFAQQLLGFLPMACARREQFRAVVGAEKNFRLHDSAISGLIREKMAVSPEVGAIVVGTYASICLGTFYKKEGEVPEGVESAVITDTETLFADLVTKKILVAHDKRPDKKFWRVGKKHYVLAHKLPSHLYGKVVDGLNARVGEIVAEKRENFQQEIAEAQAKANAGGRVEDILSGKTGVYFLELHPQTDVREVPMKYSYGPKKGKVIVGKDDKPRTRLETVIPERPLRRQGSLLAEVSADGKTMVVHQGWGFCAWAVKDAKDCGVKWNLEDLDFEELDKPPFYKGNRKHEGRDFKAYQRVWYYLRDIAEYQKLTGDTAHTEKVYQKAKKENSQVPLADLILGDVTGSAFAGIPDLLGDPKGTWDLQRPGGSYWKKARDSRMTFFDKVSNSGVIFTREEDGRLHVTCPVGPLVWVEAFASYLNFAETDPDNDNLERADSEVRGLPVAIYRFVKGRLESQAKKATPAPKKKTQKPKK